LPPLRGGRIPWYNVFHAAESFPLPFCPNYHEEAASWQALIEQGYRNGGYDADIDHRYAPDPPLSADDEPWADGLLHSQGRRSGAYPADVRGSDDS